jgi:hypothetical protein
VVVVLYLAVDDFTQINDYHGHEAGDLSLIVLSTRLRDALPEEDTVARLGGDEFVLDRRRMGLVGARSRRRRSEGRHVLHGERAGAVCRAGPAVALCIGIAPVRDGARTVGCRRPAACGERCGPVLRGGGWRLAVTRGCAGASGREQWTVGADGIQPRP